MAEKQKVTPWKVEGEINYDKLIEEFGTERIDAKLAERIKKHAKKPNHMLERGIFFSHRSLNFILDEYEKNNKFYLYTGRGPSGNTHLGHLIPWIFTKWLQDVFGADLWFQLTDDEKFLFKDDLSLEETNKMAYENALDVIALGFKSKKTFIFSDTDFSKTLYKQAIRVAKKLTVSTTKATFGLTDSDSVGKHFFTSMQSVPAFLPSVLKGRNIPCLIPHAIDQDPHFRLTRDIIHKLGYYKPASIHCMFLPPLTGPKGKMSSSIKETAVYTTDPPETVEKKVKKYAFSGGQPTMEEHRKKGGNPEIDTSYQWLRFFEEDNEKLRELHESYSSGKLSTGELKQILIDKLNAFLKEHQKNRNKARKTLSKFVIKD